MSICLAFSIEIWVTVWKQLCYSRKSSVLQISIGAEMSFLYRVVLKLFLTETKRNFRPHNKRKKIKFLSHLQILTILNWRFLYIYIYTHFSENSNKNKGCQKHCWKLQVLIILEPSAASSQCVHAQQVTGVTPNSVTSLLCLWVKVSKLNVKFMFCCFSLIQEVEER